MRAFALTALVLLATPAFADDWEDSLDTWGMDTPAEELELDSDEETIRLRERTISPDGYATDYTIKRDGDTVTIETDIWNGERWTQGSQREFDLERD